MAEKPVKLYVAVDLGADPGHAVRILVDGRPLLFTTLEDGLSLSDELAAKIEAARREAARQCEECDARPDAAGRVVHERGCPQARRRAS
ncbi:MAG TPA: hypothetical protein VF192_01465 [Longimicrobiales bacterium]